MPQFQTSLCPRCGAPAVDDVESHELALPDATLEVRFCSNEHRNEYLSTVVNSGKITVMEVDDE